MPSHLRYSLLTFLVLSSAATVRAQTGSTPPQTPGSPGAPGAPGAPTNPRTPGSSDTTGTRGGIGRDSTTAPGMGSDSTRQGTAGSSTGRGATGSDSTFRGTGAGTTDSTLRGAGTMNGGAAMGMGAARTIDLETVRQRGQRTASTVRRNFDARLRALVSQVDQGVVGGDAVIVDRLAREFNATPDSIRAQQSRYGLGFGDVVVARTLSVNVRDSLGVTSNTLLQFRQQGETWATIAAGLGLELNQVVTAVQAETKVARGLAEPDGRVAAIRAGTTTTTTPGTTKSRSTGTKRTTKGGLGTKPR